MSAQNPQKRQGQRHGGCGGGDLGAVGLSPPPPPLTSLPDEALRIVLAYSLPRNECQAWEWIGLLGQTCRVVRRLAREFCPTTFKLEDFVQYPRLLPRNDDENGEYFDARVNILKALKSCRWMCAGLKQFHVNVDSVLKHDVPRYRKRYSEDEDIRIHLRSLLTAPGALPMVEWLDVCLDSDYVQDYDLIDSESLSKLPSALPSLKKLCLSKCFPYDEDPSDDDEHISPAEVSPDQLAQFFKELRVPLTSLSLNGTWWMTDQHIVAFMPVVGENLTRLEIMGCPHEEKFSDTSLVSIANHAAKLESLALVNSDITSAGLEKVLSANPNIVALNLSSNGHLDATTVSVISRCLPRLKALRSYWQSSAWLNDNTLIALIEAQKRSNQE